MSEKPLQTYKNVMEEFVEEEIKYQIAVDKNLAKKASYLNLVEVATFALNRLPCYYASSVEGVERQRRQIKEKRDLKQKISFVVTQAFAAVERDPLRRSTPIIEERQDLIQEAKEVISRLDTQSCRQELSWIVSFIETFLINLKNQALSQEEIIKFYYLLYYYWQEGEEEKKNK
ncbi:MAG: late competence development ComFB family protein [Geminocystis sp.]|nr:late competence development ComFB family protein [Geminocystis sp.]HIK36996.1 late competence development ComFB family protein [Geminocystis sp. M7585_C2015_104]MCS7147083.1 late competence development ComFB family protein [Geminocystis sp.]MCX8079166.1 late competence development ComFB family protein [Geminocystis sp.]MDW8115906.1 late competence development ComFB family protein [Geminocystis sp.]